MSRQIELLAPARDLQTGAEAILHGADAVYIGAQQFGARSEAGNSVADIEQLCLFAHRYAARVYVTVNTILFDDELPAAEKLIWALWDAGVDALIVQDMALLHLNLPPILLHASTQTDLRTPERAKWLAACGFEQLVVARELSLDEIRAIAVATDAKIEAFCHGALCVSYSGRCYASQENFHRSANRGRCAQFCRLPMRLVDSGGTEIPCGGAHPLSLADMNRSGSLREMLDAGVTSLKIEGRLKDTAYVKNITAFYSQRLDEICRQSNGQYMRASIGRSNISFTPDPHKSFNRGFTEYFLHGRTADVLSPATPKSRGEEIGHIRQAEGNRITIDTAAHDLQAGDGLCFFSNATKSVEGALVNRVEGSTVILNKRVEAAVGKPLFRNFNNAFNKMLARPTATRTIACNFTFGETPTGFQLTATAEDGCTATARFDCEKTAALKPQADIVERTLKKLGGTEFRAQSLEVNLPNNYLVPASLLTACRREVIALLQAARAQAYQRPQRAASASCAPPLPTKSLNYEENVSNELARQHYAACGIEHVEPAYELQRPAHPVLMTCRHCLRYSLGHCTRHGGTPPTWREPLYLVTQNKRFPLFFDCKHCQMQVRTEEKR